MLATLRRRDPSSAVAKEDELSSMVARKNRGTMRDLKLSALAMVLSLMHLEALSFSEGESC